MVWAPLVANESVSNFDQRDVVEIDDRLVPAGPENDRDPVAWLVLDLLRTPDADLRVVAQNEAERLERLTQEQAGQYRRGERSATTESDAASGQRMPFPDYVSAQGPVPTPWTQVDPVVFSRLRPAAPAALQRPSGCAWSNSGRMVENVSRRTRSVDVFQQGRFLFPCQPLTSPLPKSRFHH